MEDWLQLMMSGNSTLTEEILRLLHTAVESGPRVQQAALEASVLPALLDLLSTLTEGTAGIHVDSTVTVLACDLLDWFLLVAGLAHSVGANRCPEPSPAAQLRKVMVYINPKFAAQLTAQLVAVLEQTEGTAVSAAVITCLYRMACMEEDPVPDVSVQQCNRNCQNAVDSAQQLHANASVEHAVQLHSPHSRRVNAEECQLLSQDDPVVKADHKHPADEQHCSVSEVQPHCLSQLVQSGGAVEGVVVVAATLTSDGPSGRYWPHVVAVLAVLSWVAAALVRAIDGTQRFTCQVGEHPGKTPAVPRDLCMTVLLNLFRLLATHQKQHTMRWTSEIRSSL